MSDLPAAWVHLVDEIKASASIHNEKASAATAEISNTQSKLGLIGVGLSCQFRVNENSVMGYGKLDGEWVIFVELGQSCARPLLSCSRETRIEFASHLTTLLRVVRDELRLTIESCGLVLA